MFRLDQVFQRRSLPQTPRQLLQIRPVHPDDTAAIEQLLMSISPRSRYLRYFSNRPASPEWASSEARRLARRALPLRTHLLASVPAAQAAQIVAIGELVQAPEGPQVGELALLVHDDWQRQGIGSALLRELLRHARARGMRQLRADLLAENEACLRLLRHMGLPYTSTFQSNELELLVSIG